MRLFNLGPVGRDSLQRLSEEARLQIAAMEQLIERTGLDVDELLAHFGSRRQGAGGPFIAISPADHVISDHALPATNLNSSLVPSGLAA